MEKLIQEKINYIKKLMLIEDNEKLNTFLDKLISIKPYLFSSNKRYNTIIENKHYPIIDYISTTNNVSINSLYNEKNSFTQKIMTPILYIILDNIEYCNEIELIYTDNTYIISNNNNYTFNKKKKGGTELEILDVNGFENFFISNYDNLNKINNNFLINKINVVNINKIKIYDEGIKEIIVSTNGMFGLTMKNVNISEISLKVLDNIYNYLFFFKTINNISLDRLSDIPLKSDINVNTTNGLNISYLDFILSIINFVKEKNESFYKRLYKKGILGDQSPLMRALSSDIGSDVVKLFSKYGFDTTFVKDVFSEKEKYYFTIKLLTDSKIVIETLFKLLGIKQPDSFKKETDPVIYKKIFIENIKRVYGKYVEIRDNNITFEDAKLLKSRSTVVNFLVLEPTQREIIFEKQRMFLDERIPINNELQTRMTDKTIRLELSGKDEFIMEI